MRHSLAAAGSPGALRVLTRAPTASQHPETPRLHTHPLAITQSPTLRGSQGLIIWESFGVSQMLCMCSNMPTTQSCKVLENSEVKLFGTFSREATYLSKPKEKTQGRFQPPTIPPFPGWSDSARSNFAATPKHRPAHLSDHGHNFCRPSSHTPCISWTWSTASLHS